MKLKLLAASVAGLLALGVAGVRASDPIGVYALVEKAVIMLPKDTRITSPKGSLELWGAFSFAVRRQPNGFIAKPAGGFGDDSVGDVYGPVQKGYLYFACAGNWDTCYGEWTDLKLLGEQGKVAGFGGRYANNGRLRPAGETLGEPDPYPLNMGVVPVGSIPSVSGGLITNRTQYPDLIAALAAALSKK
jgi:hypothetical protein